MSNSMYSQREMVAMDAINKEMNFTELLKLDKYSDCTFEKTETFIEVTCWEFGITWRVFDFAADDGFNNDLHVIELG